MTEQTATADETTSDDATEGSPAQSVRVPNVSPNAKSGLDHTIIGANALTDAADDPDDDEAPVIDPDLYDEVPEDQEEALRWVAAAEDSATAKQRADATWARHGDSNDTEGAGALATALRSAVYGDDGHKHDGGTPEPAVNTEVLAGTVDEVNAYLDDHPEEAAGLLAAEAQAETPRVTITEGRHAKAAGDDQQGQDGNPA